MYIRYTSTFILLFVIFLMRVWSRPTEGVWSRPTEGVCGGEHREGDKWFDGCRWCVCRDSMPVCSTSECSILMSRLPPCKNLGSSWLDGCYSCKCGQTEIYCEADVTCVQRMRFERFRSHFLSHDACAEKKDGRCVCGIDSVPSCTSEVIDKSSLPVIAIQLRPTDSTFDKPITSSENINFNKVETSDVKSITSSQKFNLNKLETSSQKSGDLSSTKYKTSQKYEKANDFTYKNYEKYHTKPVTNQESRNGYQHRFPQTTAGKFHTYGFQTTRKYSSPVNPFISKTTQFKRHDTERNANTCNGDRSEPFIVESNPYEDQFLEDYSSGESYEQDGDGAAAESMSTPLLVASGNRCKFVCGAFISL